MNKIGKGLVSFTAIIILLVSILATSIFFENKMTGKVVFGSSSDSAQPEVQITEIDDISELQQLSEGWYRIRHGYIFYLENFDSEVPLWVKVTNPRLQNGIFVVDADGNVHFDPSAEGVAVKQYQGSFNEQPAAADTAAEITGRATGMER